MLATTVTVKFNLGFIYFQDNRQSHFQETIYACACRSLSDTHMHTRDKIQVKKEVRNLNNNNNKSTA